MNGKRILTIMFAVSMVLLFSVVAWSDDRYQDRRHLQNRQIARIHKGLANGKITPKEYQKLTREQHQIQRAREKSWSNGKFTRNERNRLENLRRKAGRHIYMATHNHHNRYSHKAGEYSRYCYKDNGRYHQPSAYRYDNYYRSHAYRQNKDLFSGTWMEPGWDFSFYSRDLCRR